MRGSSSGQMFPISLTFLASPTTQGHSKHRPISGTQSVPMQVTPNLPSVAEWLHRIRQTRQPSLLETIEFSKQSEKQF